MGFSAIIRKREDTLMTSALFNRAAPFLAALVLLIAGPSFALAAEKSIFSPIIAIDKERGFLFVSSDSGVVVVEASEEAKPHIGKLPISGMIDIVVELRGRGPALLKSWKLVGGESECKVFDGKSCK